MHFRFNQLALIALLILVIFPFANCGTQEEDFEDCIDSLSMCVVEGVDCCEFEECLDSEICVKELEVCKDADCNSDNAETDCCIFEECLDSDFCEDERCEDEACLPEDTCCQRQVCADAPACIDDLEEPPSPTPIPSPEPEADTCDSLAGVWDTDSIVLSDPSNQEAFVNDPCLTGVIDNLNGSVTIKNDSGIYQTGTPKCLPNGDCLVHAEGNGPQAGSNDVNLISNYTFFREEGDKLRVNGTSQYAGNPFPAGLLFGCDGFLQGVEGDY